MTTAMTTAVETTSKDLFFDEEWYRQQPDFAEASPDISSAFSSGASAFTSAMNR